MNIKKIKIDFKIFNSFIMSLGVIFFFLSFSFDNFWNTVFNAFALILVMFPRIKPMIVDFKAKKYFNLDFMCIAAFVYLLVCQKNSNALWCALLYSFTASGMDTVFNLDSELLELFEDIKQKKYHTVADRNSEITNALDIYKSDFVELFSGEVMPVDGTVKAGTGTINAVNISGDSKAISVSNGMDVLAGYTLLNGHVIVEATTSVLDSKLAKSVEKVKGAASGKTIMESYGTAICNALSVVAVITLWIFCAVKFIKNISDWEYITYTVPMVFIFASFSGLQSIIPDGYKTAVLKSAQKGIIIAKNKFIERTLFVKNVAFFTRGVITNRFPSVRAAYPSPKTTKDELLLFTAYSQYKVNKGVLSACVNEIGKKVDKRLIKNYMKLDDNTAIIKMEGIEVLSGPADSLLKVGIRTDIPNDINKICVAVNGEYIGYVEFEYFVKENAKQAIDNLRLHGIKKTVVLSQESQRTADSAAISCGMSAAFGDLTKAEIKEHVDNLGKKWLVLADGIDAQLLSAAPVITYDYEPDLRFDANFNTEDLSAPAQYIGILASTKALMIVNFVFEILLKAILLIMILNGSSAVWLSVVLSLLFKLVIKVNNYRVLNRI